MEVNLNGRNNRSRIFQHKCSQNDDNNLCKRVSGGKFQKLIQQRRVSLSGQNSTVLKVLRV